MKLNRSKHFSDFQPKSLELSLQRRFSDFYCYIPTTLFYSSGDKMVVKDNCPIFDAWIVVSEQAIPTENQAFAALTVPLTVNSGTVQAFKWLIKALLNLLDD